ncbi:hypothetical protein HID58_059351 [Brassica napus]|uniref:Uncharacterized protein n=1 Tax=Brassica napus TaxID=3708 RepID=A0ABQ7ZTF4_BRANA|nr:hypothetical protein HID58_059351 [Brassica napus]
MIVKEMMNQTALLLWHKAQPVFHLLDLFPEQALKRNQMLFQQGKPPVFHHQMILMTTILMETQKQLIMEILPTLSVLGEKVNQLRAEHSTLLGRLGDMNQKYDAAAAVDNRILRADIETREQKRNSEKSDGSEPFAVGKTKHGHASEQHTENPKYYWYRFITKQRVEVNREGLQNRFATNPKNMYETIGITSINHKIESSTL